MTPEEQKEVIRVCGPNYDEIDIPAYIRKRDKKVAEYQSWAFMKLAEAFGLPKDYAERHNPFQRPNEVQPYHATSEEEEKEARSVVEPN